jgi:DNA-binding transcriptional regulator YhcF (GntR family)
MTQNIKLDEPQKKQFNSIMAGMEFIDEMTAKGYSVEEAFTMLEKIVGIVNE